MDIQVSDSVINTGSLVYLGSTCLNHLFSHSKRNNANISMIINAYMGITLYVQCISSILPLNIKFSCYFSAFFKLGLPVSREAQCVYLDNGFQFQTLLQVKTENHFKRAPVTSGFGR